MENSYILGGLRSYVGVINGMYRHIPAEVLGAEVLKQVMEKYQLREPDYIIAGNGVGAGGNIARLMALTGRRRYFGAGLYGGRAMRQRFGKHCCCRSKDKQRRG